MRRVAILGAGIMGASLAILLARRGCAVTVFDREEAPVACASRWNEGKIHLGYLYGADPTLAKRLGLQRQWLHATKLGFTHPGSGEHVEFESPYPDDLQHALNVVRG